MVLDIFMIGQAGIQNNEARQQWDVKIDQSRNHFLDILTTIAIITNQNANSILSRKIDNPQKDSYTNLQITSGT